MSNTGHLLLQFNARSRFKKQTYFNKSLTDYLAPPLGLSINFPSFPFQLSPHTIKPFFGCEASERWAILVLQHVLDRKSFFFLFYISRCFDFCLFLASVFFLIHLHCYAPLVDRQMAPRLGSSRGAPSLPPLPATIFLPPIVVRREANSKAVDDQRSLLLPLDFIGSTIVLSTRHTKRERRTTPVYRTNFCRFYQNPPRILKDARLSSIEDRIHQRLCFGECGSAWICSAHFISFC